MRILAAFLLVAAVAAAALPIDDSRPATERDESRRAAADEARAKAAADEARARAAADEARARAAAADESRSQVAPDVPRARCPTGVATCESVRGRVLYVERVDPDGDGDLHVVVLDGSVTGPGMTAVDVRPALRPRRDPSVGDEVSAAGPVQPGSYGQSQIHALEFHTRAG
jgi:hypothetical protein